MDGLSIINDLFQMNAGKSEKDARKAFKAQKAFNLASALTNTYLAVTAALANKKEIFPGQRFIEAGLAGAAGAVQVQAQEVLVAVQQLPRCPHHNLT